MGCGCTQRRMEQIASTQLAQAEAQKAKEAAEREAAARGESVTASAGR